MATLTVRNLDDAIAKQLRIRAAEHGRSAEAEHREILRAALLAGQPSLARQQAADRLAEFREQTGGRGSASSSELLAEVRAALDNAEDRYSAQGIASVTYEGLPVDRARRAIACGRAPLTTAKARPSSAPC